MKPTPESEARHRELALKLHNLWMLKAFKRLPPENSLLAPLVMKLRETIH